ncbi:MAG: WD40 repeat domain-containing protein [Crocosphaera sp.]|uniref:WD40 repeat domain-containing protein n=1 Tax=Crocosphaera sp. TaxID=2729996 RepID=UPI00258103AF|nr:WD40 repeat domain-containing protein [Crocosphaera sp.]MCH2246573.1 WD40 repeat domain-containing protein [Crocosphaera sp.]NQZ65484.1 WD40 repeat domain-containing protein [Crocosphaera sp.]
MSEFQNWKSLIFTSYDVDVVAFSPDGRILASGNGGFEHIKLWDVVTDELLYQGNYIDHVKEVGYYPLLLETTLFFTPDGNALILNGFIFYLAETNVINVKGIQAPN